MNRIAQLRKEKGLSQRELADKLGVHQTAVSQWETERTVPEFSTIFDMAAILDVNAAYLMGRSSDRWSFMVPDAPDLQRTRLTAAYDKLNDTGQRVAVERVEELAKIPDYQRAPAGPLDVPTGSADEKSST